MWPFDKKETPPQEDNKTLEENKIALNKMTELVQRINASNGNDQQTGLDYETWKRRVLKEGRGY
jgi:hypothetical protein